MIKTQIIEKTDRKKILKLNSGFERKTVSISNGNADRYVHKGYPLAVETYPDVSHFPRETSLAHSGSIFGSRQDYSVECLHFTVPVCDDSMRPYYHKGDVVVCRKLKTSSWMQWGRAYLLDTAQGVVLKRIYKCEGGVRCVSFNNEEYPEFEISDDEIYSRSLVVGVMRWGN